MKSTLILSIFIIICSVYLTLQYTVTLNLNDSILDHNDYKMIHDHNDKDMIHEYQFLDHPHHHNDHNDHSRMLINSYLQIPKYTWRGVACSSNGKYIAAVGEYTNVYVSNDYGNNWTETNVGQYNWEAIASDSTGQHLGVVGLNTYIFTSGNWYLTSYA